MIRVALSVIIVLFLGSLSAPFSDVYARSSKWDARNSMTPTESFKYHPTPFNDPSAYGIHDQKKQ